MSDARRLIRHAAGMAAKGLLLATLAGAAPVVRAALPEASAPDRAWIASPERRFGAAQVLVPGRAILYDEVDDPSLAASIAAEVRRLRASLFVAGGWRSPLPDDEPLRIYVARRAADGVRRIATSASAPGAGRASGPALMLDASRMTDDEIAREVARQVARATLAGYGVAPDAFLESALAEWLAAAGGDAPGSDAWSAAASPEVDVAAQPAALGRLWVDEVARAAGNPAFLREAWEKAAETGESPRPVLLRLLSERARVGEDALLARFAARLYARVEPEASPSRLRPLDLESGALDASAPESLRVRHRSFLPEGAEDTLRVEWPEDAAAGAAVVRYRDDALPPDAVFFSAGDRRAIPLAGVARVDFVVGGSALGGGELRAPVRVERSAAVPYSGLDAHVSSAPDGPRVWWTTASHEGLWGWAIFREAVLADGRVVRTGPEIVPSTESSPGSYRYAYVDRTSSAGTFYRYTVWAVTDEGLLARAFAATLKTSD
jgi:hypothetical protein